MKSVLISIQPKGCENIAKGKKTIEVKKTRPKIETPFKCYIYCTKNRDNEIYKRYKVDDMKSGKIIGEFVCDELVQYNYDRYFQEYFVAGYIGAYMPLQEMCLTQKSLFEYGKGKKLYGWHISDLKIYDKPKELREFGVPCMKINEIHCRDCKINDKTTEFCYKQIKPLNRPPQSWCYVEEC